MRQSWRDEMVSSGSRDFQKGNELMEKLAETRILAQAVYEAHELPEGVIIDDHDGFEVEDNGSSFEFRRKVYFYSEHDDEDQNSLIGYFNVTIDAETLDIGDAYFIASMGGVLVGEFTADSRASAYSDAGIPDPRTMADAPLAG